jgi:Bacterial Ig-like domain
MAASLSDIITQNTLNKSEGFPQGVPHSWNWYKGWNDDGLHTPPADFTALAGWGQVYQKVGASPSSNAVANVEVANAKTYVRLKETGQWVLVEDQSRTAIVGGHFVTDFAGNAGYPMVVSPLAGGGTSFSAPPAEYNDHFWHSTRGTYAAGTVDAVYVQMDMRVTDPNLKLVAMVGADWWRDADAPFLANHSNNPGIGGSNWVELSTQWRTVAYYSLSTAEFQSNLPPPFRGAVNAPPVINSDTTPPAAPTIASFTPDTGTIGDQITGASVLTLSGTAEASSIVKLFDGATQIGTTRANSSGAWSIETSQLAAGTHNFTATATDPAGNTGSASSLLNVMVDAAGASPPPASPRATPSGENLLEMFDATSVGVDERAGFNGNDGSDRTVQTVARQGHNLSFDARSPPGFTGTTTTIEVLSNDPCILIALLFGALVKIGRNSSLAPRKRES